MKIITFISLLCIYSFLASCQSNSPCAYDGNGADYLLRIGCVNDFDYLKGRPLTEKFGQAASVKIVYSIADKQVYFINSSRYPFHYEFCTNVLGVKDDVLTFNITNYKKNHDRQYILCNLNYYSHLDIYALEFMAEDDTDAGELFKLFEKIRDLTPFGRKIKMLISNPEAEKRFAAIPAMPTVLADEIYKGRQYV